MSPLIHRGHLHLKSRDGKEPTIPLMPPSFSREHVRLNLFQDLHALLGEETPSSLSHIADAAKTLVQDRFSFKSGFIELNRKLAKLTHIFATKDKMNKDEDLQLHANMISVQPDLLLGSLQNQSGLFQIIKDGQLFLGAMVAIMPESAIQSLVPEFNSQAETFSNLVKIYCSLFPFDDKHPEVKDIRNITWRYCKPAPHMQADLTHISSSESDHETLHLLEAFQEYNPGALFLRDLTEYFPGATEKVYMLGFMNHLEQPTVDIKWLSAFEYFKNNRPQLKPLMGKRIVRIYRKLFDDMGYLFDSTQRSFHKAAADVLIDPNGESLTSDIFHDSQSLSIPQLPDNQ